MFKKVKDHEKKVEDNLKAIEEAKEREATQKRILGFVKDVILLAEKQGLSVENFNIAFKIIEGQINAEINSNSIGKFVPKEYREQAEEVKVESVQEQV